MNEYKYMKHIFLTADERSDRRKILAVKTQLKQLRDESLFIIHRYITNWQNFDQLQVGLIAQLVEYFTGTSGFLFATA